VAAHRFQNPSPAVGRPSPLSQNIPMKAVLLISHGSHSPKTKQEVVALIKRLQPLCDFGIFEYAFLEIEKPSIPEGIDICVEKGATDITVLLNFLNSGKHVDDDIPRIIKEAKIKHAGVNFGSTIPVGQHPQITELFLDLLKTTL